MMTHGPERDELLAPGESSRIWRPGGIANVELLYGRYRRFSFARHFHPAAAVGVVETGAMRTYFEGATYLAPAGTILLFNPGDVHAPQPVSPNGWSFRMFYLEPSYLQETPDFFELGKSLTFGKPFIENAALSAMLGRMHRCFEVDAGPLDVEARLASALAHMAEPSLSMVIQKHPDSGQGKIDRAREYLRAYCHRNITLKMLSVAAGLSPYHLVRSFRKRVGITPHAYLMQARIERSRILLRAGTSISDVALQTGFTDQSHFTRQFKKFTGVTPGRYHGRPQERRATIG